MWMPYDVDAVFSCKAFPCTFPNPYDSWLDVWDLSPCDTVATYARPPVPVLFLLLYAWFLPRMFCWLRLLTVMMLRLLLVR
jgi:hypothetical protein